MKKQNQKSKCYRPVHNRFMCFFISAILSFITVIASPIAASESAATKIDEVNVMLIVLDEAPLFPLLRTDGSINSERFPGFAMLAENSTWYRNTIGTAQRTTEAVPAILDGRWPTFRNYPYLKDHPNNLFTLFEGKRNLNVYQAITHLCPKRSCPNGSSPEKKTLDQQVLQLRKTISSAATSSSPSLHFAHVLLPHRPWGLVPDLRLVPQDKRLADLRPNSDSERRRDNYSSFLRQYVATDKLVQELVTQMKASNNWDNTLLIVTADHGITFVPGETYRDKINTNRPETLEDIYRIPLFIKYPNQMASRISDCSTSSIDVLQTVIGVTSIKPKWTTEGVDLSKNCPNRPTRTVRWPKGSTSMRSGFRSAIARAKYYDRWVDANGNVDDIYRSGLSGSILGESTPSNAIQEKGMTWELNRPNRFQLTGSGEFAPIVGGASGKVFSHRKICHRCEGLIAINNQFVGVITELTNTTPSQYGKYFSSNLMTRLMRPGPAQVELWIANWTKPTPVFTRVGLPRNAPIVTSP